MPTLAVVIPTYRRPRELARCLAALALQTRPPDEVVVAAFDDPDAAGVADRAPLTCTLVAVDLPGAAAAMVAGTRATGARLICFTDDNAVPPPRWVERLEDALDDPTVGGAGGRDVVVDEGSGRTEDGTRTEDVGRLTWYGRHVGGHHLAEGAPRDVAFLKGVNAAYRREALACGVPVIVTDAVGAAEGLPEDVARIVEPGDVRGLDAAVRAVLALEGDERAFLAARCRTEAGRFAPAVVAERLLAELRVAAQANVA